jgi:hypothetical protein
MIAGYSVFWLTVRLVPNWGKVTPLEPKYETFLGIKFVINGRTIRGA